MQLSGNDALRHQPVSKNKDSLDCLEDIEGKTIGNLLPDEDDLFSGMTDVLGYSAQANGADDFEDFDLFSNGGGLELGEDRSSMVHRKYDLLNSQAGTNGSVVGEQPSRTLFVRNINSNIEDSELKALFEVLIFASIYISSFILIYLVVLILQCILFFLLSAIWRYKDSIHSLQAPWFCHDYLL